MQKLFAEKKTKEKIRYDNEGKSIFTRTEEWNNVAAAVMTYQKQFDVASTKEEKERA